MTYWSKSELWFKPLLPFCRSSVGSVGRKYLLHFPIQDSHVLLKMEENCKAVLSPVFSGLFIIFSVFLGLLHLKRKSKIEQLIAFVMSLGYSKGRGYHFKNRLI